MRRDPLPTARKLSMNHKHTMRLIALAGLAPLFTATATAQPIEPGQVYGGISVGASRATIDEDRIRAGLSDAGLATTDFSRDERSTAWRLFGGYQMSRNFGVELGYFNLGKFGFGATTTPAGTLDGSIRLQGINLDLVGTLPLTDRFAVIGRVGAAATRARDRFDGSGAVSVLDPNPRKSAVDAKFGIGVQYAFSPSVLLRAEVERYRVDDAVGNRGGVNVAALSLVIPFGGAPAPTRMAAAPVYVPPPPPPPLPPPVVQAPPLPAPPPVVVPERRRVSFSAESLFTFDRSEVKPEGRAALDKFAADTRGTSFDVIVVEGHTDRLGSEAYNQKLSGERAAAVKAYLVGAGGFEAAKVNAIGRGETQPVTQPQDCKGNQPTPKLIACLQPDRRVEIEVTGTR